MYEKYHRTHIDVLGNARYKEFLEKELAGVNERLEERKKEE